jgi:hypothetical protein
MSLLVILALLVLSCQFELVHSGTSLADYTLCTLPDASTFWYCDHATQECGYTAGVCRCKLGMFPMEGTNGRCLTTQDSRDVYAHAWLAAAPNNANEEQYELIYYTKQDRDAYVALLSSYTFPPDLVDAGPCYTRRVGMNGWFYRQHCNERHPNPNMFPGQWWCDPQWTGDMCTEVLDEYGLPGYIRDSQSGRLVSQMHPYTTGTTLLWSVWPSYDNVPRVAGTYQCEVSPFNPLVDGSLFFTMCTIPGRPDMQRLTIVRLLIRSDISCSTWTPGPANNNSPCPTGSGNQIAGEYFNANVLYATPYSYQDAFTTTYVSQTAQNMVDALVVNGDGTQCVSPNQYMEWDYYTHQGTCRTCSTACVKGRSVCLDTSAYSCTDAQCTSRIHSSACYCSAHMLQDEATGTCYPPICPDNLYGLFCDLYLVCPVNGTTGFVSPDGLSAYCECVDPSLHLNPLTGRCETQHCGRDRDNLCSGSGLCVQGGEAEYCSCDRGWTGQFCEIRQSNFDECDCGVQWGQPQFIDTHSHIQPGYTILTDDTGMPFSGGSGRLLGRSGVVVVGHEDQAKHLCYADGFCDAVALAPVIGYYLGETVFRATFLTSRFPSGQAVTSLPTGTRLYAIDRNSAYRCSSLGFDIDYYLHSNSFANTQLVATYCSETAKAGDPSCNSGQVYWAVRHYRYVGHLARLSPNSGCQLTPIVYEPEQYCAAPRCLSVGYSTPCNSNGFCINNPSSNSTSVALQPYACECAVFDSGTVQSNVYGLNGKPAWIGNACQFSVAEFCVRGSDPVLCSGYQQVCKPKKAWNGEFFLQNFKDGLHDDYLPACDCTGLPAIGQYCEESACGVKSHGCKSLGASGGECMTDNGSDYFCACGQGATGTYCEIDKSGCLFNGLSCAGQGVCVTNSTATVCQCADGFFGSRCEKTTCMDAIMVAGHGLCANGILQSCYPPYSGTRCEQDNCALFGGTVIGSPAPSGCSCPDGTAPLLNGVTVATCWPQCPVIDGHSCGATGATCLQSTVGQRREATCQCPLGYTLETDADGNQHCQNFCAHGTPALDFNPFNPTQPCVCSPDTGFDTAMNHPRCDHPICNEHGVYENGQCTCEPPYTSSSNCAQHSCSSIGYVVAWIDASASSPYRCACDEPQAPSNPLLPYDCSGTVCANGGSLFPFWRSQPEEAWCLCSGKWTTSCSDPNLSCQHCGSSVCLNGGFPSSSDSNTCVCPFPYYSGDLGVCESSVCPGESGESACICDDMHTGLLCEQTRCMNGQLVDGATPSDPQSCVCVDDTWTGPMCDVPTEKNPAYVRSETEKHAVPDVVVFVVGCVWLLWFAWSAI